MGSMEKKTMVFTGRAKSLPACNGRWRSHCWNSGGRRRTNSPMAEKTSAPCDARRRTGSLAGSVPSTLRRPRMALFRNPNVEP